MKATKISSLRRAIRDAAISLCFILLSLNINAQTKPLQIGDTVPVRLKNLYKDGLLIINFWATWCGPCLKELPVLDSAANDYKGKFKVLSVTYEPESIVKAFLAKKQLSLSNLNILTADTLLHQIFPHRIIPHNIWVDAKGIILQISDSEGISKKNIGQFLNGVTLNLNAKKDKIDFDSKKAFHLRDSSFSYRSILTGYVPGIGGGQSFYTVLKKDGRYVNRLFGWNYTIHDLYLTAYSGMKIHHNDISKVDIQTTDSLHFSWPKLAPQSMSRSGYKNRDEWCKQNLYCYELRIPKPVKDSIFFAYMLEDLNRNFGYETHIEQKLRPCLVISSQTSQKQPKPSRSDSVFINLEPNKLRAQKATITEILTHLIDRFTKLNDKPVATYFMDERKKQYPFDLLIETDEKLTLQGIIQILEKKYGFQFKYEKRKAPILVITDNRISNSD